MNSIKKILVTGGRGYIGSNTIIDLLESGYNLSNSNQETIKKVHQITKKSFKNYVIDLCDINLVYQIFELEKPTHIIHFAAFKSVPESVQKPLEYYQNNLVSLINILQLSQDFKVEKFIFSSSCSVYGNPSNLPVTEESPLLIVESTYASTKQICEKIIQDFSKVSEIKFTILRYFNPVGNHQSGLINQELDGDAMFPNLIKSLQSNSEFTIYGGDYPTPDGTPIRDFIHVMDIARAHTLILISDMEKAFQY
jgi:UDP-glucose 4-epimerase